MKQICSQCCLPFEETSIQYSRRTRNNGPKICQQCYRISHAEKRYIERLRIKEIPVEKTLFDKALKLKKRHKRISIPYLIKEFKISNHEACVLADRLEQGESYV
jgi:hypothetical protein